MRRRAALAAAVIATTVYANPAAGGPKPHVIDPRGDWPVAAQDILAATFSTTGKGRDAELQIRLELAGAPAPDAALYWEVGWSTPDCALNYIEYTRSAYGLGVAYAELIRQCRPGGPLINGGPASGRLEGSAIILSTPLERRYPTGTLLTSPFASSYGFYFIAPGVSVVYAADKTNKGRAYRVQGR